MMEPAERIEKLKAKAEKGSTPVQIELGHSYLTGTDYDGNAFPQDYAEAKQWLERAHEKGAFTATTILGTIYEEGKGVPINIVKAIELYELAIQRGAYLPCLYLARIYSQGKGVEKSKEQAAKWYKKLLSFKEEVNDTEGIKEAQDFFQNKDGK